MRNKLISGLLVFALIFSLVPAFATPAKAATNSYNVKVYEDRDDLKISNLIYSSDTTNFSFDIWHYSGGFWARIRSGPHVNDSELKKKSAGGVGDVEEAIQKLILDNNDKAEFTVDLSSLQDKLDRAVENGEDLSLVISKVSYNKNDKVTLYDMFDLEKGDKYNKGYYLKRNDDNTIKDVTAKVVKENGKWQLKISLPVKVNFYSEQNIKFDSLIPGLKMYVPIPKLGYGSILYSMFRSDTGKKDSKVNNGAAKMWFAPEYETIDEYDLFHNLFKYKNEYISGEYEKYLLRGYKAETNSAFLYPSFITNKGKLVTAGNPYTNFRYGHYLYGYDLPLKDYQIGSNTFDNSGAVGIAFDYNLHIELYAGSPEEPNVKVVTSYVELDHYEIDSETLGLVAVVKEIDDMPSEVFMTRSKENGTINLKEIDKSVVKRNGNKEFYLNDVIVSEEDLVSNVKNGKVKEVVWTENTPTFANSKKLENIDGIVKNIVLDNKVLRELIGEFSETSQFNNDDTIIETVFSIVLASSRNTDYEKASANQYIFFTDELKDALSTNTGDNYNLIYNYVAKIVKQTYDLVVSISSSDELNKLDNYKYSILLRNPQIYHMPTITTSKVNNYSSFFDVDGRLEKITKNVVNKIIEAILFDDTFVIRDLSEIPVIADIKKVAIESENGTIHAQNAKSNNEVDGIDLGVESVVYLRYLVERAPKQVHIIEYKKNGVKIKEKTELKIDNLDVKSGNCKLLDLRKDPLYEGITFIKRYSDKEYNTDVENLPKGNGVLKEGEGGLEDKITNFPLDETVYVFWEIEENDNNPPNNPSKSGNYIVPQWRLSKYWDTIVDSNGKNTYGYSGMSLLNIKRNYCDCGYSASLTGNSWSYSLVNPNLTLNNSSNRETAMEVNPWLHSMTKGFGDSRVVTLNNVSASARVTGNLNAIKNTAKSKLQLANWISNNSLNSKYYITNNSIPNKASISYNTEDILSYRVKNNNIYTNTWYTCGCYNSKNDKGVSIHNHSHTSGSQSYGTGLNESNINYTSFKYTAKITYDMYNAKSLDKYILPSSMVTSKDTKTTVQYQPKEVTLNIYPEYGMLFTDDSNNSAIKWVIGDQKREITPVVWQTLKHKVYASSMSSSSNIATDSRATTAANKLTNMTKNDSKMVVYKGGMLANAFSLYNDSNKQSAALMTVKTYALDITDNVKS